MITEQQIAAYLAGQLTGEELARFEQELAGDENAMRMLVEQERMDVALRALEGQGDRAVVKQAIMEVVAGPSHEQVTGEVMEDVVRPVNVIYAPRVGWWSSGRRTAAWVGLAAAACVALLAILRPGGGSQGPTTVAKAPTVPPLPVVTALRDPAVWPFAPTSPWNMPIGMAAKYEDVSPGGLDITTGALFKNALYVHPIFIAKPTDPMAQVFAGNSPAPMASLRIPTSAFSDPTKPMNVHLVAEDGFTLYEIRGAHREGQNDLRGWNAVRGDLRGSGIPPELASANNSGLSALCGSLRIGELTSGIRRAIGAVVPLEAISYRVDGTSTHVWPAGWGSGSPDFKARFGRGGNIHFGTLLAIPPTVDIATLGVGTNGPAFEIARAMQDYGVYIKDCLDTTWMGEWQQIGRPNLIFCIDAEPSRDLPRDLPEQLRLVTKHLKVVVNNGPNSIGGGGAPRRPLAPGFITPGGQQ